MRSHIFLLAYLTAVGTTLRVTGALFPDDVIPNQYIVRLRKRCTFSDHAFNIRISVSSIGDLESYSLGLLNMYLFNASNERLSLDRVLTDDECVHSVLQDQRTHNVSEKLIIRPKSPQPQMNIGDLDPQPPTHAARSRTWKKGFSSLAPWDLRMLTINEKKPIPVGTPSLFSVFMMRYTYSHVRFAGIGVNVYQFGFHESLREPQWNLRDFTLGGLKSLGTIFSDDHLRHPIMFTGGSDTKRAIQVASVANGDAHGVARHAKVDGIHVNSASGVLIALCDIFFRHQIEPWPNELKYGSIVHLTLTVWDPALLYEIQRAIKKLDDAGILVVAPAGNLDLDVGPHLPLDQLISKRPDPEKITDEQKRELLQYPCKFGRVLCVGAVNISYEKANFSSYGRAVSLWAPGQAVGASEGTIKKGHWISSNGTEFASSMVAGIAALFLSFEGKTDRSPRFAESTLGVRELLFANGKRDYLQGLSRNSRNLLANTGIKSTTNPDKPYNNASDLNAVNSADRQELLETSIFHSSDPEVRCFNSPRDLMTLEYAHRLLLRLMWERGHSMSSEEEDEYASRLVKPIPCISGNCVFLDDWREDLWIRDTTIITEAVMHILRRCSYEAGPPAHRVAGSFKIKLDAFPKTWFEVRLIREG